MTTLKYNNLAAHTRVQGLALRLILQTLPVELVEQLTGKQLALVCDLCEATYLDGLVAGGGDPCDTVSHVEEHRAALQNAA